MLLCVYVNMSWWFIEDNMQFIYSQFGDLRSLESRFVDVLDPIAVQNAGGISFNVSSWIIDMHWYALHSFLLTIVPF